MWTVYINDLPAAVFDTSPRAVQASRLSHPHGAAWAFADDKMFMTTYKEGFSKVNYLYTLGNTRSELTRWGHHLMPGELYDHSVCSKSADDGL